MITGQALDPAPAVDPQNPAAPTPSNWYGNIDDAETVGYIKNKGWDSTQKVVDSYKNLESMYGHDKAGRTIVLPKDGEDKAEFYTKLGRPEQAEGYKLDAPENSNENTVKWFKEKAFELGLSQDQASSLFKDYNEYSMDGVAKTQEERDLQIQTELNEVKKEWGAAYDAYVQAARYAATQFNIESQDIDQLEMVWGPKKTMNLLSEIGRSIGEDSYIKGNGPRQEGFVMSPGEAKAKITDLKLDENFVKQYMSGNPEAVKKLTNLTQLAYPE